MLSSSNVSSGGAVEEKQCIVNNQMDPFIVLYILILIVGLPGNLLSVWAFIQSHRTRSTGVYLLNLLMANILLLLALPFKVLKDLGAAPWTLMVFHCQASAVTIYISLYASIAFLTFIIDRHTVRSLRLQERGFAWLLSVVVWMLLLLIMVPNMALPTKDKHQKPEKIGLHWHTLTIFLCTALFLNASAAVLVSSGLALRRLLRSRSDLKLWEGNRQVMWSVVAMALAYMLSFIPYHVVRTPYTLAQTKVITDCQTKKQLFLGKESTLLLSVLHVCFDPLLFFHLNAPFRRIIRKFLSCSRKQTAGDAEEEFVEETMLQRTDKQQDPAA
uniref:G protein-coupled receptor 171 n=1 Tax=Kryptolebias marmoratus TaxID=37003 RepID=A0A3Q3ASL2_KRYMA